MYKIIIIFSLGTSILTIIDMIHGIVAINYNTAIITQYKCRKELKMLYFDVYSLFLLHCIVLYCICKFSYTACFHVIAFNKNNFVTNYFHFRYTLIAFITLISSFSVNFRTQYLENT